MCTDKGELMEFSKRYEVEGWSHFLLISEGRMTSEARVHLANLWVALAFSDQGEKDKNVLIYLRLEKTVIPRTYLIYYREIITSNETLLQLSIKTEIKGYLLSLGWEDCGLGREEAELLFACCFHSCPLFCPLSSLIYNSNPTMTVLRPHISASGSF